jgi:hypothetical protein
MYWGKINEFKKKSFINKSQLKKMLSSTGPTSRRRRPSRQRRAYLEQWRHLAECRQLWLRHSSERGEFLFRYRLHRNP